MHFVCLFLFFSFLSLHSFIFWPGPTPAAEPVPVLLVQLRGELVLDQLVLHADLVELLPGVDVALGLDPEVNQEGVAQDVELVVQEAQLQALEMERRK